MRILTILALAVPLAAQAPPLYTQIQDTVYTPIYGVTFNGNVKISAPVLVDENANTIGAWNQTQAVSAGVFNVSVAVNPTNTTTVMLFTTYNGASWYEVCDILYSATPVKLQTYCQAQAVSNSRQALLSVPYPGGPGIPYVTGPLTARVAIDCADYASPTCIASGSIPGNFSVLTTGGNLTAAGTAAFGGGSGAGGCVHYRNPGMIAAADGSSGSTLAAPGTLYVVGDTGSVTGGLLSAAYQINSVDGGGGVLTYQLTYDGNGYTTPASGVTTSPTSGVGSGFEINITAVNNFDVAVCPPFLAVNKSWNLTMHGDITNFPWSSLVSAIQGTNVTTTVPSVAGTTWYFNPTGGLNNTPLWALGNLSNLSGTVNTLSLPTQISPASDSTAAFQFMNAAQTSTVLSIDTSTLRAVANSLKVNGASTFGANLINNTPNGTVTGTPTAGSVNCSTPVNGTAQKVTICVLAGYQQTGSAQTYVYPTAFTVTPILTVGGGGGGTCGTYNPTTTTTTLTMPANAAMTAETCTVKAEGR